MKTKVKRYLWKSVCLLLLILSIVLFLQNNALKRQMVAFERDKEVYAMKESKAYIVERISKQMEEIAYQQKDISDMQREEAIHQMDIAEEMRVRAEEGENLAKEEQRKVQQYAYHLEEAKNVAVSERAKAIQQQQMAEMARNEADTLSRISLARSLASSSLIQYQSGKYDISGLLSYGAWQLMKRYKGNVYHPIIYEALSKNSKSYLSKKINKGGITRILLEDEAAESYLSVSKYGEISRWHRHGNQLKEVSLLSDSVYSFRDAYLDGRKNLYALDFCGNLVVIDKNQTIQKIVLPEFRGWSQVRPLDAHLLMLVAAQTLYFFDTSAMKVVNKVMVPQQISAIGKQQGEWLVFGKEKGCWKVNKNGTLTASSIPVDETVCAYAWSDERGQVAIGTESGNIYVFDEKGTVLEILVGHRSKVTQLAFSFNSLFSSSYDGNVNVWNLDLPKIEALSLLDVPSWIYCFQLSKDSFIWIGDESGVLHCVLYSPDDMAKLVKQNLKRDFTDDEWNYYLGKNIPRERLNISDKE